MKAEGVSDLVEVSVLLTDDESMALLNQQHLGHGGTTDVISFPSDPRFGPPAPARSLGDLILNLAAVARQAAEYHWSEAEELALLAAHGTLHLLGYDDQTRPARAVMERKQRAVVASLRL